MNRIKKLLISVGAVLAIGAVSVTAMAAADLGSASDFGSSAVETGKDYTLTQMLTYAVQDEALAYAEYIKINEALGNPRPFANIVNAEKTHIAALEKLAAAHSITLPENTAGDYVTVPASLTDALNAGVQAEKNNIAMYTQFLSTSLPDDVKTVFTALKNASGQHLAAVERSLSGAPGSPAMNGNGNGNSNRMNGTRGYAMNSANAGTCTGTCDGTGTCTGSGGGTMNRGQMRGQNGTGTCTGSCVLQ